MIKISIDNPNSLYKIIQKYLMMNKNNTHFQNREIIIQKPKLNINQINRLKSKITPM